VIVCLVDAFGWRFFTKYRDRYPFLSRFVADGFVSKLTSQFPSTTAAHITAMHTGLPVGQSGVYEWFYYEPQLDAIIAPLLFSFAGDNMRNTLNRTGIDPARLYPNTTQYHALQKLGIKSFVLQHRDYTPSPMGSVVCAGAREVSYANSTEAIRLLAELALAERGKAYFYLYLGAIDMAGHRFGIASPQFDAEVHTTFTQLEELFHAQAVGTLDDTLFLLTADHGQVEADPARAIYLNHAIPEIAGWLVTSKNGRLLVPAGSCRDMFLHILPDALSEAHGRLQELLAERAEVHRVRDLIAQGFFGSEPLSPAFLGRVGNLVVLPFPGESVWWYEKGRFIQDKFGHHGGLSSQEMETQILALPYR
jgi:predicted AlkP superfamily pyrophosphatase or phosphodiesterase